MNGNVETWRKTAFEFREERDFVQGRLDNLLEAAKLVRDKAVWSPEIEKLSKAIRQIEGAEL